MNPSEVPTVKDKIPSTHQGREMKSKIKSKQESIVLKMTVLNWNLIMTREFWKYVWVKWLYVKFAEKVKRKKKGVK